MSRRLESRYVRAMKVNLGSCQWCFDGRSDELPLAGFEPKRPGQRMLIVERLNV